MDNFDFKVYIKKSTNLSYWNIKFSWITFSDIQKVEDEQLTLAQQIAKERFLANHEPAAGAFYFIFPLLSKVCVVFYTINSKTSFDLIF